MKAAVLERLGQAPRYGVFEEPTAGAGETMVEVRAAGPDRAAARGVRRRRGRRDRRLAAEQPVRNGTANAGRCGVHAAAPSGRARSIRLRWRGLFIACHRSLRRCTLSQKSGLLPNNAREDERCRRRHLAAVIAQLVHMLALNAHRPPRPTRPA